jgi:hypothetical protein
MKIAGAKLSILARIDTTMVSDYKKARQVDAGRRRKALNGRAGRLKFWSNLRACYIHRVADNLLRQSALLQGPYMTR